MIINIITVVVVYVIIIIIYILWIPWNKDRGRVNWKANQTVFNKGVCGCVCVINPMWIIRVPDMCVRTGENKMFDKERPWAKENMISP